MYSNRILVLFSFLMVTICIMIVRIYGLSEGKWLSQAATNQSTYNLEISKNRGNIYDCNMQPLVGRKETNIAAVFPSIDSSNKLCSILNKKEREQVLERSSYGKPFIVNLKDRTVISDDIDVFRIPIRYSDYQLAPHIIGYLDNTRNGVAGIEKSYNEYLSQSGGGINVKYKVDAVNNILEGDKKKIDDTSYMNSKGVVLTLDSQIQEIAQRAARKNLKKGAVIVTEVPTCKLRAIVSMPDYSQNYLSEAIESSDAPLINRAFTPYNVGSIFKLVTASVALERGLDCEKIFECDGHVDVEGKAFNCYNGSKHGKVNLSDAIAYSCNSYFVDISKPLLPKDMIDFSKKFGFGESIDLAPGLVSDAGNLPEVSSLYDKMTMANFSFGQGEFLGTPLQVSGLINAIASGGEYSKPQLVEGLVDENLEFIQKEESSNPEKIISEKTTNILINAMKSSVEYGTSIRGKPENGVAAAKTATAETGILKPDGTQVIQAWYAGFYPADNPKYSIVVLAEDGVGGGESCGPVFKQIVDDIYFQFPNYFNK